MRIGDLQTATESGEDEESGQCSRSRSLRLVSCGSGRRQRGSAPATGNRDRSPAELELPRGPRCLPRRRAISETSQSVSEVVGPRVIGPRLAPTRGFKRERPSRLRNGAAERAPFRCAAANLQACNAQAEAIAERWRFSARKRSWCGRRDLNPHDLRHWNLNPARLPVPPRPHIILTPQGPLPLRLAGKRSHTENRIRKQRVNGSAPLRRCRKMRQRLAPAGALLQFAASTCGRAQICLCASGRKTKP